MPQAWLVSSLSSNEKWKWTQSISSILWEVSRVSWGVRVYPLWPDLYSNRFQGRPTAEISGTDRNIFLALQACRPVGYQRPPFSVLFSFCFCLAASLSSLLAILIYAVFLCISLQLINCLHNSITFCVYIYIYLLLYLQLICGPFYFMSYSPVCFWIGSFLCV